MPQNPSRLSIPSTNLQWFASKTQKSKVRGEDQEINPFEDLLTKILDTQEKKVSILQVFIESSITTVKGKRFKRKNRNSFMTFKSIMKS